MICKVYPIYSATGIAVEIDYIMNPSKVVPDTKDNGALIHQLPETMVQEVTVTEGEVSVKYVSSYLTTPEEIKDRILYLQNVYACFQGDARACGGPIAYHIIISAAPNEHISDDNMHLFAAKVLELLGYPAIWSTHIRPVFDKKWGLFRGTNKHAHAIVSAFPDDVYSMPQKLELGLHNERLRTMVDRLAIEHGYQTVVDADYERSNSYYGSMKARQGDSWMQAARDEVSAIALEAMNRTEFERLLTEHNYTIQQIGDDYLYNIPGGHQVMGHKLGRDFTVECLENRWLARREGAIDEMLDKALPKDGRLYVSIPLGGRFKEAKTHYRCCLQALACDYCESSLMSYFRQGCMYEITDEEGKNIRCAEGQQILDFLGVGDAWEREPALSLEARRRRLSWHLERIRQEAELQCERHAQSSSMRFDCWCRRQASEREERKAGAPERKRTWKQSLRLNGEDKTLLELMFLLICEAINPDFDSGLWEWVWEPIEPFNITEISPAIWALVNAYHIVRTEGVQGLFRLEKERFEATLRYEQVARELAEVRMRLETLEPLWETAWRCKSAKHAFDMCCERVDSYEELCYTYPTVVVEYEEAVHAARAACMEHWGDVEHMVDHCFDLQKRLPALRQAVAAEYERMRQRELSYSGLRLDRERRRLDAKIVIEEPKPSLGDVVKKAELRKEADQRSGKSLRLECNSQTITADRQ